MDKSFEFGNKSIGKLLWQFSWPAIVGMLVNALYNIVDRIFVGRGVGTLAIAATTVAFPIMLLLMALGMLVGIGATALISIRLGEQKKDEAEKIVGNALTLLIMLPLLFMVFYFSFSEQLLVFFGANQEVLPNALDFTNIIVAGSVFGAIGFGMNNFIRAEGNPRIAMLTQILGAVINGVLNYIFIFHLGLGIAGSALATVSGQFITSLWVLGYFLLGHSTLKLRLKNLKPDFPIYLAILSIGFAPFAMQLANSVQNMLLNKSVMLYGGDLALSAIGVIMSISTLFFMPIIGVSQGAQPIIGFNYGAGQFERVKATLKKAIIASTCIAVVGYLVIHFWPEQIIGLFSDNDKALTELATHVILVFFTMFPLIGFQIICSSYFQAVGKPLQSSVLSLSRQVLLYIPLLLVLPHFWGIEGVWRAAPIADILSVLITATLITLEMKRLSKNQPAVSVG